MERVDLFSVLDGVSNCVKREYVFGARMTVRQNCGYLTALSGHYTVWKPILPFHIHLQR